MSLFDERALREIVAEELRRVLREESAAGSRRATDASYLPVAEAAARASVAPATIRVWMAQGRLGRYHAGRELRVRSSELAELMRRSAVMAGIGNRKELTPEKEADLYLERRRARAAKRG
jgi:hypothetical protein